MSRIDEMRRMRFEEGLSTQKIGDYFGISRERVRQLLGNTGWVRLEHTIKRHNRIFETPLELSDEEVANQFGVSFGLVRSIRRGLRRKFSGNNEHLTIGEAAELLVSNTLKNMGIRNELTPRNYSCDIILSNGTRVEVQYAYVMHSPSQRYPKLCCGVHDKEGKSDFFIVVAILEDLGTLFYVMPTEFVIEHSSGGILSISYSSKLTGAKASHTSIFDQYRDAFDILR